MKRLFMILTVLMAFAVSCDRSGGLSQEESVVVLPDGPVMLQDARFGMYYGNIDNDGLGLFSIVLSDARCYQDKLNNPYLDSEGDMLVLQIKTPLLSEEDQICLPAGEYAVSDEVSVNSVKADASYVRRQVGSMHKED